MSAESERSIDERPGVETRGRSPTSWWLVGVAAVWVASSLTFSCTFDESVGTSKCRSQYYDTNCGPGGPVDGTAGSGDGRPSKQGDTGMESAGGDGAACEDRTEICNGSDDDCDGIVDEGCPCDYLGKSRGVCRDSSRTETGGCKPPDDYESDEGSEDCDGLDNDCDGEVDENCECPEPGVMQTCYPGPSGTEGVGTCEAGTQTCGDDNRWGPCEGATTPSSEICTDDKDTDCDGIDDNGCRCNYEGKNDGVCENQSIDREGDCTKPGAYQAPTDRELCDGRDNDCDGTIDEGCGCNQGATRSCYEGPSGTSGIGICEAGTEECRADGTWGPCTGQTTPASSETCDGADDDCDGTVDEGCGTQSCAYQGKMAGVCQNQTVSGGSCTKPNAYESTELSCNDGLDNDCDGETDEASKEGGDSCGADCQCQSGECVSGTCAHLFFVTDRQLSPDFGGFSRGKTICQNVASSAGYGGTWKPVLSGKKSAKQRISIQHKVWNTNGDKIADGANDFWDGSLDHDVDYTETGADKNLWAWTGSRSNGTTARRTCSDWTSDSGFDSGIAGQSWKKNSDWISASAGRCSVYSASLYCIDGQ